MLIEVVFVFLLSGKIVSPKWKSFKGLRLLWRDKIRLNNGIWRAWFIQCESPDLISSLLHTGCCISHVKVFLRSVVLVKYSS